MEALSAQHALQQLSNEPVGVDMESGVHATSVARLGPESRSNYSSELALSESQWLVPDVNSSVSGLDSS